MAVPRQDCPGLYEAAAKIASPGSAAALFQPCVDVANHLLGHVLGGLRHFQVTPGTPAVTAVDGSFWAHRHPNCDHLFVWVKLEAVTQDSGGITIQAGTGSATYRDVYGDGVLEFVVPWGASDSGWNEVTIATSDAAIKGIAVWDLPRSVLDAYDHRVEYVDSLHPLGGFEVGRYLIESSQAGMGGLLAGSVYSWDDFVRPAVAWWTPSSPRSVNSTSWTNPFSIPGASTRTFRHRARQRQDESTRDLRAYAFTYCAPTVTGFEWRVSSTTGTVATATLTHTSGAWTGGPIQQIPCYTGSDDPLTFQMRRTGGTGLVYVSRLTIGEDRS